MDWYFAAMQITHSLQLKEEIKQKLTKWVLIFIAFGTLTTSCISDILKFQSKWIASFSKTSFKLPLGQYSVRISTVGHSMHAPKKRTVFSCVTSLTFNNKIVEGRQWIFFTGQFLTCFISHRSFLLMSTFFFIIFLIATLLPLYIPTVVNIWEGRRELQDVIEALPLVTPKV